MSVVDPERPHQRKSAAIHSCQELMRPEEHRRFMADAEEQVRIAYAVQGRRAFDYTQSAAASHEAGHAIYFTTVGIPVTGVRIWHENRGGRRVWLGITDGTPAWRSDAATSPEADLAIARGQISGVCGEMVLEGKNFRQGSSIDEVTLFRMLVATAAWKLGKAADFPALAAEQLAVVTRLLLARRRLLEELAAALIRRGHLRGERLNRLLGRIRP